jgi:hypothetical protein
MLRGTTVNCMLPPDCMVSHGKTHQREPHKQKDTSSQNADFFSNFKAEIKGNINFFLCLIKQYGAVAYGLEVEVHIFSNSVLNEFG